MSSLKTDKLQLNKWVPTDYVNMNEFNDNFQKIDDAHKDVTTQLADITDGWVNASNFQSITDALNEALGKTLVIPSGTYTIDTPIDIVGNINIVCLGDVIFDGSSCTPSSPVLTMGGTIGSSVAMTKSANKGDVSFDLSNVAGISVGDILKLQSTDLWNTTREYYYKGELVEVTNIVGNTVYIKDKLYDSYNFTTTTATKLNMATIGIDGLTIARNGGGVGLVIQYSKIKLKHTHFERCDTKGAELINCIDGVIENGTSNCNFMESTGLSYGITFNSCQNMLTTGGHYKAGRHGIAQGGTIPCRNMSFQNVITDNDDTSGVQSFDSHGNVEFLTVDNLTALNGANISAINVKLTNSTIKCRTSIQSLYVKVETDGSYLIFDNVTVENSKTNNLFRVDSDSTNYTISFVKLNKILLVPPANATTSSLPSVMQFKNVKTNELNLSNISYENSNVENTADVISINIIDSFIYKKLIVENINLNCNNNLRCFYTNIPSESVVFMDKCTFGSAYAGKIPVMIQGLGDLTISNTIVDGMSVTQRNGIRPSGKVKLKNVTFKNFINVEPVRFENTKDLQVDGITLVNCTNASPNYLSTLPYAIQGGYGQRVFYFSTIPTTGTYNKGDIVYSTLPVASGSIGWVCTVAGDFSVTAPVFKPFGTISS